MPISMSVKTMAIAKNVMLEFIVGKFVRKKVIFVKKIFVVVAGSATTQKLIERVDILLFLPRGTLSSVEPTYDV